MVRALREARARGEGKGACRKRKGLRWPLLRQARPESTVHMTPTGAPVRHQEGNQCAAYRMPEKPSYWRDCTDAGDSSLGRWAEGQRECVMSSRQQ